MCSASVVKVRNRVRVRVRNPNPMLVLSSASVFDNIWNDINNVFFLLSESMTANFNFYDHIQT